MPDDLDYAWLGWLLANPDGWTDADLSAAESLIANQRRALEDLHPNDVKGRSSAQDLLDRLEAALRAHRAP